MKSGLKSLTVLLAILGIGDLAMVPVMIAANHHHAGTPPAPAIALGVLFGPNTFLNVTGGIGFALSVAAIVQLIRLNPRRVLRHAAAAR